MTYLSNLTNSEYSRIRPYLNVDGTPLVDAVCLKPCNDHVSKTNAAAFKEKCFCGSTVITQEDDPIFQFYSNIMHNNAKLEVELAKKNEELFSLRDRLQKQREESDTHQKKYQDLQATVNKLFRTKHVDKPQEPMIQASVVSQSTPSVSTIASPMKTTSAMPIPPQTEQKDLPSSTPLPIPNESHINPAPNPMAPKRKKTDASETAESQSSAKVSRDSSPAGQSLSLFMDAQAARAPLKKAAAKGISAKVSKKAEKTISEKSAEKKRDDVLKRVSKKTEKAKALTEDLVKTTKTKAPSAKSATPEAKPGAIQSLKTVSTVKPAAPKRITFVDYTSTFIPMKKPAAKANDFSVVLLTPNKPLNAASDKSEALATVPVIQKDPAQAPNKIVVTQVIASAAPMTTPSTTLNPPEGVITSNVSAQTASLFAAPVQVTTPPAPAETAEGMEQRAALKNKVTNVLAGILAKKQG